MQKGRLRKIWKWTRIIAIIYVILGIAIYFLQEKVVFQSVKLPADHVFHFPQPFREVNVAINNEKNLSVIQFTVADFVRKGLVLYFHGNRDNIERYARFASNFTNNNYEVWMIDYPGYGKTTGERSEQIIYDDALQFYKLARARFSRDSIIIYGRSLGTGIATQLASVRDCKRLILEAPYYSMDAMFRHYLFIYPFSWIVKYHFPTYQYLEKVNAPVTIFHGTADQVVPFKQSKWLMEVRNENRFFTKQLIPIEGAKHNSVSDFPEFHQKLDSILQH